MSKVISFRLDEDNSREARAIEVLHAWTGTGHSVRYTLTEALLKLEYPEPLPSESAPLGELTKTLDRINILLEQLGGSASNPMQRPLDEATEPELTGSFIEFVREIAKPGLRNT